ncbi:Hydroxyneurosporene synthase [Penicillium verhagenii]|nr:Hydroxyneurosporene synthase [Penicillium verhagenii]
MFQSQFPAGLTALSLLLSQTLASRIPYSNTQTWSIPSALQNGTVNSRLTIATPNEATLSTATRLTLDGPQISKVTADSFDWWYFDAVSSSSAAESVTITLFTAASSSFPWLSSTEDSVLIAYLWAGFENGTVFADYVPATLATVSSGGAGDSGVWNGSGFGWVASEDLSYYEVVVESEEMGVYGTFILESQQSPHLPCGIQGSTSTLEIVPNIGWASLVPDSVGNVDLTIQGSELKFQGRGYHDKNWSNLTFVESVQSWYWGHGRVGDYSIVWFSAIATDNTTYTSSYVALDDKVIVSSCDAALLTVRPVSSNSTTNPTGAQYPPRMGDVPDGFTVEAELADGALLKVNVSIAALVSGDDETYTRWSGDLVGSVVSSAGVQSVGSGVAVFEQFTLVE